jgi:putative flippase GtrA
MHDMARSSRAEFLRFLIAGGIAALVNIASRVLLDMVMAYEIAIVVAYAIGMTCAFLLNRRYVFPPSRFRPHQEYARFAFVNLLAVVQVWIVSVGLARYIFPGLGFDWHAETVAHVIGVMVPVLTSYLGHRHFSFARETSRGRD